MHHICPDCGSDPCICNINDTEHNIINIADEDEDEDICPVCHEDPCTCECDLNEDTIIDIDDIATCPICHHDPCECDCTPDNDLYESDSNECPICHSNPCICDIEECDECDNTFYEDDIEDTCECDCDDLDESYIVEETDNQSINMIYDYVTKVANYCAHVGKRISKDDPDFDKYKKACNSVNKCLTDLAGILS